MKILWASNAPWGQSGYANQSALFGPRIAALGHDLAFYSNIGNEHATLLWNGHKVYPGDQAWGNKTLMACAAHHADALDECQVIYLGDSWVLDPTTWHRDLRLALWAPVDHAPLPPNIRQRLVHPSVTAIAMSKFGQEQMQKAGIDALYVPHAVDTELFRPRPDERLKMRREANLPEEGFVVGMVAANSGKPLFSRKAFPQAFMAFALFREEHPDAVLYVHSNEHAHNNEEGGLYLRPLARACGIPSEAIRFTEQFAWDLGVKREDVALLMSTFDVLLSPSFGEGFGIPIIEAQACGVPVIATNWTAMSELTEAGWLVDGDPWYDAPQDSFFKCPSVGGIVKALTEAYAIRGNEEVVQQAREFAFGYATDHVLETYWKPVLEQLDRPTEVPPLNRAMRRAKQKVAA